VFCRLQPGPPGTVQLDTAARLPGTDFSPPGLLRPEHRRLPARYVESPAPVPSGLDGLPQVGMRLAPASESQPLRGTSASRTDPPTAGDSVNRTHPQQKYARTVTTRFQKVRGSRKLTNPPERSVASWFVQAGD